MAIQIPPSYFPIRREQQQFYFQALIHLGFAAEAFTPAHLEIFLSPQGEQQGKRKNYLGDSCIFMYPKQLQLWREQENVSLSEENFAALCLVLKREPIIGRVVIIPEGDQEKKVDLQKESDQKYSHLILSQYLHWLSRNEFPHLYASVPHPHASELEKASPERKKTALSFPVNSTPAYLLESPTGLLARLFDVQERKQELRKDSLTKLLDTAFLQRLQQDIRPLQALLGSLENMPLVQPFVPLVETAAFSAVCFPVSEEEIYIISSNGQAPLCVGMFSAPEKMQQYHLSGMHSMVRYRPEGFHTLLNALLSRKSIQINRAYGAKQLTSLETLALRKRGFSLLAEGGNPEQGRKLVQLRLSAMEKYALLSELFSQDEQMDYGTWQSLQDVIMQEKELSSLPEKQLLHFVETGHPVISRLFSRLQLAGSYGSDEQRFVQQFTSALVPEYRKALLAEKIAERVQQHAEPEKIVKEMQHLVGAEQDVLIHEVMEVLQLN